MAIAMTIANASLKQRTAKNLIFSCHICLSMTATAKAAGTLRHLIIITFSQYVEEHVCADHHSNICFDFGLQRRGMGQRNEYMQKPRKAREGLR